MLLKKLVRLLLGLSIGLVGIESAHAERVRLLVENADALQARADIISGADHEVLAEYFSVWNDDESVKILLMLLNAAHNGKKVKIIMDSASNTVPPQLFKLLLERGRDKKTNVQNLEIKVYNSFSIFRPFNYLHRDHAKMLIVDGDSVDQARLITGGRNVGDKYFGLSKVRNFRDLDIITEKKVATDARANFMQVWESSLTSAPDTYRYEDRQLSEMSCNKGRNSNSSCEDMRLEALKIYHDESNRIENLLAFLTSENPISPLNRRRAQDWLEGIEDAGKVHFLAQTADKLVDEDSAPMSEDLMKIVLRAKKDLNILSPYLIPTSGMLKIFKTLIEDKHVRIRIVTNSLVSTDNLFAQAGYRSMKDELIRMGVELYEFNGPDTTHAKVAVVDGVIAMVGTFNLDARSSRINREVGVVISETPTHQLANTLTDAIEGFREDSLLVGKEGKPQNQDLWDQGVQKSKLNLVQFLMNFLPLFISQV